jgi:hypothetical protein
MLQLAGLAITGHSRKALASVRDLPEPALASAGELDALLGRARLRVWSDDLAGAYRDLAGLVRVANDRSMPFRVFTTALLGEVEYRLGLWDDALVHCDLAVSIGVEARQPWLRSFCHATAALVRAARGQWEEAEADVNSARTCLPQEQVVALGGYNALATAHLARARGQPERVIAALDSLLHVEHRDGIDEPAGEHERGLSSSRVGWSC